MANYTTATSRLLSANGHVLKSTPTPLMEQQGVVQLHMPMASVIADTKVTSPSMQVVQAVQVGGGGVQGVQPVEGVDVPRTKGGKEKRYPCPYCTWSGVDNWCLKRHLNTHLKPYVCALCDYKAARTERLQTHVLKVHNKRSCIRCSYMADDQNQLNVHLQEQQ